MKSRERIEIEVGEFIPTMQPSYATQEEVMAAHGTTFADLKYDGYRAQVHKWGRNFRIFTRNGNELKYECYPDLVKIVDALPDCIIEAEIIGDGKSHKEAFDMVKKRFRRPGISDAAVENYKKSGIIHEVPLSLRVFDTLYIKGDDLTDLPLSERRGYTESFDRKRIKPAETEVVRSAEELEALLEATFRQRQEGRVCKNPSSLYLPGQRTIDWVKFKRSEPLDLVVVGTYKEDGCGLDLPFTSVLVASYNPKTGKYETLGKVGATRNSIANEIHALTAGKETGQKPSDIALSDKLESPAYRSFVPHRFIDPEESVVLEVRAMNLNFAENWQSCGMKDGKAFSMRIGYCQQVRHDKSPRQATTTDMIREIYRTQEAA